METFRTEGRTSSGNLRDEINEIKEQLAHGIMKQETEERETKFKFPFKWRSAASKSKSKLNAEKVLVLYLNIKGEIEPPVLLPLFGNIIIYKNKAHEFDPRACWLIKIGKNVVKVLIIKEIDRRPVSNLNIDEIKRRGDSTDSDEILVKMVTRAVLEKSKKPPFDRRILIGAGIAVLVLIIYFFFIRK